MYSYSTHCILVKGCSTPILLPASLLHSTPCLSTLSLLPASLLPFYSLTLYTSILLRVAPACCLQLESLVRLQLEREAGRAVRQLRDARAPLSEGSSSPERSHPALINLKHYPFYFYPALAHSPFVACRMRSSLLCWLWGLTWWRGVGLRTRVTRHSTLHGTRHTPHSTPPLSRL